MAISGIKGWTKNTAGEYDRWSVTFACRISAVLSRMNYSDYRQIYQVHHYESARSIVDESQSNRSFFSVPASELAYRELGLAPIDDLCVIELL